MGFAHSVRVWIMRFATGVCVISSAISPLQANQTFFASNCDPSTWLQKHAALIEEEGDLSELVLLICMMRNYVVSQGCEIPDLRGFLGDCRTALSNQGFFIDEATFRALEREIRVLDEEIRIDPTRHRHRKDKKKDKELKINSKTAVGFLKFVAGSLLCIVPIPLVQGAGLGLAVLGVSEMADGAREQSDERDKQEQNQRINRQLGIQN
jgi:hypothetical protein